MSVLSFPSFAIELTPDLPDEIVLMLLGGRRASAAWLASAAFYTSAWAVDSGVEMCRDAGIVPERLIGDMDSADPLARQWAESKGAGVYAYKSEKDLTDFQLALELLSGVGGGAKGLFLTGAFGGRLDHLISVLNSFVGWSDRYLPVGMADEKEALFLLRGGSRAEIRFSEPASAVSLIPLRDSRGVSIGNVRWPLDDVILERNRPYSISNRPDQTGTVTASVGGGLVGLYCAWPGAGE